ncbi:dnaJ homolog subfamily C member 12 [Lepeophtheirus salmonis]|uniref:dnaJ homolog subfamily C member 12 n=1 Tax=Lepeophtheirus salmonis TaxID=72036 RepID=UPI001AE0EE0C|nr:dnaJ homolog subfamily C member 12-like [Lepeophtheirus salmonis]
MDIDSIYSYKKDKKEDYYNILGCVRSSTKEQILAEYRARVKSVHPDKQGESEEILNKFKILAEAKSVLTDDKKRKDYDAWKSSGMALTYKDWCRLNGSVKTSMHWAEPNTDGKMIECQKECNKGQLKEKEDDSKEEKENCMDNPSELLSQKRQLFAMNRGDSSLNSMVLTDKISDKEMRRRFRNYEI